MGMIVSNPEEVAKAIEKLRASALFDEPLVGSVVLGPLSEQHYLLALAALDEAQRHMMLACYLNRRGD